MIVAWQHSLTDETMADDASAIDGVSLRDVKEVDAINNIVICHDPVRISLERIVSYRMHVPFHIIACRRY